MVEEKKRMPPRGLPKHVHGLGTIVGVRLRPGDLEQLDWVCEQMGMSRSDVVKRALAAYTAQLLAVRKS